MNVLVVKFLENQATLSSACCQGRTVFCPQGNRQFSLLIWRRSRQNYSLSHQWFAS